MTLALTDPATTLDLGLHDRIAGILNRWPSVGLAVGVVRDGTLASFFGHGVADIPSSAPITEDTIFRVASLSKTVTAVAVLQLWERGLIDLDSPANDYLRAYQLIAADQAWRPATVRHLLTHTAGISEVVPAIRSFMPDFGERIEEGRAMPSLAEYYGGGIRLVAEPGTRFRYGNHGFATLGQIVEDVSGQPFDRYVREHVFEPLGMERSGIVRVHHVASGLATGYEMGPSGPKPVTPHDLVTAGAASVTSTPRDMARYVAALLGGGANEHGSVLEPATVEMMFEPQYQPDPRIPGIGLAFWRIDLGGRRAVEHQGTLPGFHSQIFLAPDDGVGVMAFTNGSWRPDFWLPDEVSGLLRDLLGIPDDVIRTDVPRRPEVWGDLCGWYRLDGPLSDVRMRGMLGAGVEVFVRDGQLMIRVLTAIPVLAQGFALHPDDPEDPDVFRLDLAAFGLGSMRVVFGRDAGKATRVYLEVMPLTLEKRPDWRNPRKWAMGVLAVGTAVGAAVGMARRRRRGPSAGRQC